MKTPACIEQMKKYASAPRRWKGDPPALYATLKGQRVRVNGFKDEKMACTYFLGSTNRVDFYLHPRDLRDFSEKPE